jgi:hypothetical protein
MADPRGGFMALRASLSTIALTNFVLLLAPTTLLGATLPIRVISVLHHYRNIGVSIGSLYPANTRAAGR